MPSEERWKKRFAEAGLLEDDHGMLVITDRDGAILGQANFFKSSAYQNSCEIGYRIYKPENWGKGFTTEAVRLLVSFLFETKTVDRIQATTLPGNERSQKVLEKCGFQLEGTLRKAVFHRGESMDLHLFSVLRGETPPLKDLLA
jgi:RimJ/RimL family protein N-acetyltransferase